MNILILLKSFNYPPRNGGDQAVFSAIAKMAPNVNYHLIGTDGSEQGYASMEAFHKDYPKIPAQIYDLNQKNTYQRIYDKALRVANFINNRNGNRNSVDMRQIQYDARIDYYDAFYRFLNDYIRTNNIDIVQGEFQFTLGWLKGITEPCKKVFVHHELQYIVEYQRLMQREHSTDDLWHYAQQKQQEINALNACDAIITLSEDDRKKLIYEGVHAPVFASFAKVQMRDAELIDYTKVENIDLVFVGPDYHIPNKHGMEWFVSKVWNKVLAKHPDTNLYVVGKWCDNTREDWQEKIPNIHFLGFVDDLCDAMQGRILIVPIQEGSGIRMKILEASNVGVPFVACKVGAEGLAFTHGENAYITDDAEEFAKYINQMIEDKSLAQRMGQAANKHAKEYFSDERFVETRMRCYKIY